MIEILILVVIIYFITKNIVCIFMNLYLKNKNISYKKQPTYLIKSILFDNFNNVELLVFDYGIYKSIKCRYKDLEIM